MTLLLTNSVVKVLLLTNSVVKVLVLPIIC